MGDEIRSENDYFSMTVIHTELCKGSLNKWSRSFIWHSRKNGLTVGNGYRMKESNLRVGKI